ncbi:MAG: methanol oxidation system protein MoxJ [Methylophilaceae bacterium]|nr:methanol oxidation system protein MoxJ [Methylophilaceae bacterium]
MPKNWQRFARAGIATLIAGLVSTQVLADDVQAADLNVCAGKDELPYSSENKDGFENAIAEVIGKGLNRKVNFVWWNDPRYVVNAFLDKKQCDVVLGLDASDPRVLTTQPYYKTSYLFISRQDRGIEIDSWNHPHLKEHNFRIGVLPDSPGKVMLLQINRFDDMFDYFAELTNYQSTRNKFVRIDPIKLVRDVESNYLHAAMVWAPEASRYIRDSKVAFKITPVKDDAVKSNGEKVPMQYEVVMGVRKGDSALKQELDRVIKEKQGEINAILEHEGIPLFPISKKAI